MKWHHLLPAAALALSWVGCGSSGDDRPPAVPIEAGAPRYDVPPSIEPVYPDAGATLDGAIGAPADATPSTGDGGGPGFTLAWSLAWIGSPNRLTCEVAGVDEVRLRVTQMSTGQRMEVGFPCARGRGTTPSLPPGRYLVEATAISHVGVPVGGLEGEFSVVAGSPTDLGEIAFELQSFVLNWFLRRAGQPLTCGAVDAATVDLGVRMGTGPETLYRFPCGAGQGATPAIALGAYLVNVRLLDSKDAVLWQTDRPMGVTATDQMRATLPPVVFEL